MNKELKRCQKDSLNALAHRGVIFTFPEWKQTDSTTSLVLKSPKTESSVRKVYLPKTVALALREVKSSQDALKLLISDECADYDLVIAHEDGRPYEERQIAALLRKLITEYDLRPMVFHSLRHCSASLKLQIGGGNIKAAEQEGYPGAEQETVKITVSIRDATRTVTSSVNDTIIQNLEKHGIVVPTSCRSGECGFCHSLLKSGKVYVPKALDGRRLADLKFGGIHPCATFPLTDLEILVPADK